MADITEKTNINALRQKQSTQEYQTAEAIRAHIQMILRDRVDRYIDHSTQKEVTRSDFSPTELASMASAMESVQRVQRIALGLPTSGGQQTRNKVSSKEIPHLSVPNADSILNPEE